MVVVLLSPAKTLCWDLVTSSLQFQKPAFLTTQSDAVVQSLKGVVPAALKKLLGISDQLASLNAERYEAFKLSDELDFSADADHLRPAGFAYDGPAYLGAEFRSMTPEELDFAQQSVCILSAVYGVLKPLDLIQQYRLEMNTKLAVGDDTAMYAVDIPYSQYLVSSCTYATGIRVSFAYRRYCTSQLIRCFLYNGTAHKASRLLTQHASFPICGLPLAGRCTLTGVTQSQGTSRAC
jgi:Peroxide stress protein YaaA